MCVARQGCVLLIGMCLALRDVCSSQWMCVAHRDVCNVYSSFVAHLAAVASNSGSKPGILPNIIN